MAEDDMPRVPRASFYDVPRDPNGDPPTIEPEPEPEPDPDPEPRSSFYDEPRDPNGDPPTIEPEPEPEPDPIPEPREEEEPEMEADVDAELRADEDRTAERDTDIITRMRERWGTQKQRWGTLKQGWGTLKQRGETLRQKYKDPERAIVEEKDPEPDPDPEPGEEEEPEMEADVDVEARADVAETITETASGVDAELRADEDLMAEEYERFGEVAASGVDAELRADEDRTAERDTGIITGIRQKYEDPERAIVGEKDPEPDPIPEPDIEKVEDKWGKVLEDETLHKRDIPEDKITPEEYEEKIRKARRKGLVKIGDDRLVFKREPETLEEARIARKIEDPDMVFPVEKDGEVEGYFEDRPDPELLKDYETAAEEAREAEEKFEDRLGRAKELGLVDKKGDRLKLKKELHEYHPHERERLRELGFDIPQPGVGMRMAEEYGKPGEFASLFTGTVEKMVSPLRDEENIDWGWTQYVERAEDDPHSAWKATALFGEAGTGLLAAVPAAKAVGAAAGVGVSGAKTVGAKTGLGEKVKGAAEKVGSGRIGKLREATRAADAPHAKKALGGVKAGVTHPATRWGAIGGLRMTVAGMQPVEAVPDFDEMDEEEVDAYLEERDLEDEPEPERRYEAAMAGDPTAMGDMARTAGETVGFMTGVRAGFRDAPRLEKVADEWAIVRHGKDPIPLTGKYGRRGMMITPEGKKITPLKREPVPVKGETELVRETVGGKGLAHEDVRKASIIGKQEWKGTGEKFFDPKAKPKDYRIKDPKVKAKFERTGVDVDEHEWLHKMAEGKKRAKLAKEDYDFKPLEADVKLKDAKLVHPMEKIDPVKKPETWFVEEVKPDKYDFLGQITKEGKVERFAAKGRKTFDEDYLRKIVYEDFVIDRKPGKLSKAEAPVRKEAFRFEHAPVDMDDIDKWKTLVSDPGKFKTKYKKPTKVDDFKKTIKEILKDERGTLGRYPGKFKAEKGISPDFKQVETPGKQFEAKMKTFGDMKKKTGLEKKGLKDLPKPKIRHIPDVKPRLSAVLTPVLKPRERPIERMKSPTIEKTFEKERLKTPVKPMFEVRPKTFDKEKADTTTGVKQMAMQKTDMFKEVPKVDKPKPPEYVKKPPVIPYDPEEKKPEEHIFGKPKDWKLWADKEILKDPLKIAVGKGGK